MILFVAPMPHYYQPSTQPWRSRPPQTRTMNHGSGHRINVRITTAGHPRAINPVCHSRSAPTIHDAGRKTGTAGTTASVHAHTLARSAHTQEGHRIQTSERPSDLYWLGRIQNLSMGGGGGALYWLGRIQNLSIGGSLNFGQWRCWITRAKQQERGPLPEFFFKSRCSQRASPVIILNLHRKKQKRKCPWHWILVRRSFLTNNYIFYFLGVGGS